MKQYMCGQSPQNFTYTFQIIIFCKNLQDMDTDTNGKLENQMVTTTRTQDNTKEQTNQIAEKPQGSSEILTQQKKNQQKELGQTQEEVNKPDLFRHDGESTTTKVEQTLTQNRNPIIPKQTKIQSAQSDQKKQQKQQNYTSPEKKQQSQTSPEKQQELKLSDSKSNSERPLSINIGKQSIQIQKQNAIVFKQPEIKIQINQSVQKGFTLNKQTYYRITGFDKHGHIDIQRNVQEFESLRKILLERWPGCFVGNISLKSDLRNQQLRNQHRRKNLQSFLKKLSYCQEIYYKQQIQLFLRSYGINIQQMFNQMPILKVKDVIERLKTCFGQVVEAPNSPENATGISQFSTSLKKIANNLHNLAKRALKLAESYENYQQKLPMFSNFLSHYQQSCLTQYASSPDNSIALKDSQGKINKLNIISQNRNLFYDLYFHLQSETRDAQSLSDVILAMEMFNIKRDELETQIRQKRMEIDEISLGKNNFKVMTSRKPKELIQSQLQQRQKFLISEKHVINQLKNMSEIVLANFTIPLFKKMKINNYHHILKNWVQVTGATNSQIYQVWKFLNEEGKTNLKKQKSK